MNQQHTATEDLTKYVLFVRGPRCVMIKRLEDCREITVGRSRTADICVDDPLVSRKHVVVCANASTFAVRIRDAGSLNGTLCGSTPLVPEVDVEIMPGQEIKLGATTIVIEG